MAFGFEIEKNNYILYIGFPPKWLTTACFVFDGWVNTEQKNRFIGSMSYLSQESGAGRVSPAFKDVYILNIKTPDENKNIGTPPGSIFKVLFDNRYSDSNKIEKFLLDFGIAFHRAEPFIKPVKTLWEVIKEKIN